MCRGRLICGWLTILHKAAAYAKAKKIDPAVLIGIGAPNFVELHAVVYPASDRPFPCQPTYWFTLSATCNVKFGMVKFIDSSWDPQFIFRSPMFEPLIPFAQKLAVFKDGWPSLDDYQTLLAEHPEPILTHCGVPLKIAAQGSRPMCLEEQYASRIYLTGEIQTRASHWHDFFQLLTWLIFPKTKAAINAIHHHAAKERFAGATAGGCRSPIENMLSLFDEGGAIVVSTDASLLQMIRGFDWKNLFWQHRATLIQKMNCIIFGHALYEKALTPYVGMTANSVLLPVDPDFFSKADDEKIKIIDGLLATIFINGNNYRDTQALSPLPVLGMPGWDARNTHESYYDNARYFRPGRTKRGFP